MAQAKIDNSITSRRRFITVAAAASAVSAGTLAAAAMPAHQACLLDDSKILNLEEQIFEQHEKATAYDDEILRLSAIWTNESNRLYEESLAKEVQAGLYLTARERRALVTDMPECTEHNRLCNLQGVHMEKVDALVKEMWATPAHTSEGRRAKVLVALNCLLPDYWRQADEATDYGIREARQLLIEFVGGEPGAMLREQFA